MSQEPIVTLKPIGLMLFKAEERDKRRTEGQRKGKTDECDNLLTYVTICQFHTLKKKRADVVIFVPFSLGLKTLQNLSNVLYCT